VVVDGANNLGENGRVNGVWMHRCRQFLMSSVGGGLRTGTSKDAFRDGIEEYANLRERASCSYAECCATPSDGPSKGKLGRQLELDLQNEILEPDTPSLSKEEASLRILKLLKVQWLRSIIPIELAPENEIEKVHIVKLGMYLGLRARVQALTRKSKHPARNHTHVHAG
ncbi:hypothetical protein CPC08DRAFT_731543, partial [Agrocybe pediades]